MSFCAAYPIPATHKAIIRALCRRGLRKASDGAADPDCVIQWVPVSRVAWDPVFEGKQIASAYIAHHGLVNKQALYRRLREVLADGLPDPDALSTLRSCVLASFDDGFSIPSIEHGVTAVCGRIGDAPGPWALKAACTNNALGVHFFQGAEDVHIVLAKVCSEAASESGTWVLQQYVASPLLHDGRKFHMRVNVLAVGALSVYVRRDVVCHVASEAFVAGDWDNPWRHVTNHGVQRQHASYSRDRNTMLLPDLCAAGTGAGVLTEDSLWLAICAVVRAVFVAMEGYPKGFLPTRHCFELFGFDIMLREDGTPVLLEVNGGPALEGVAMPELCDHIVNDVLQVVYDTPSASSDAMPAKLGRFQLVHSSSKPAASAK